MSCETWRQESTVEARDNTNVRSFCGITVLHRVSRRLTCAVHDTVTYSCTKMMFTNDRLLIFLGSTRRRTHLPTSSAGRMQNPNGAQSVPIYPKLHVSCRNVCQTPVDARGLTSIRHSYRLVHPARETPWARLSLIPWEKHNERWSENSRSGLRA